MPRPKKPPRQKKSPLPARRLSDESGSPTPDPGAQSPSSPPPHLPPKPTSPKIPPRPASVRKPQAIPSAISDSTNEIKENHVSDTSSVQMDQSHSKADKQEQLISVLDGTKSDQSHSFIKTTKTDQSNVTSTKIDQTQPIYSEIDQSNKSPSETDQSKGANVESQLSPPPDLPPRPCVTGTENATETHSIELIDPVFGTPVKQNVYMTMKPAEKKEQVEENSDLKPLSELKPAEVNTDSYGMLFPKFKSTKGSSLQPGSEKAKRPELRRTNTSPDENIYIGPSSPESTLAKFKEKQGLLRRANTSPDENMYITATEKILKRQDKVESENLYSEIADQKSPKSPQSPTENIYASIPDSPSNIYDSLANATSGTKSVSTEKEKNDTVEVVPKDDDIESRTNIENDTSEQSK